ncbi:hypothetical protein [Methylotenera versatilis]|uniref:hypothetical protein n=1 Tax=Methylotenera versatilis TaxID=1055487 RepID=UPI000647B7DB|nr:hypothetical protein [Methylotenera versatilis]
MRATEFFKLNIYEYTRPWKLITFSLGLSLLIIGSIFYNAPDWDFPISVIMATITYFFAPWSLRIILKRFWKFFPAMLLITWFAVDGSYWIYWSYQNPEALVMRDVNFPASLSLYGICGLLWLYQGSLKDLFNEVRFYTKLIFNQN